MKLTPQPVQEVRNTAKTPDLLFLTSWPVVMSHNFVRELYSLLRNNYFPNQSRGRSAQAGVARALLGGIYCVWLYPRRHPTYVVGPLCVAVSP